MFKLRKYPFASDEDSVRHMVALLCKEAEVAGTPFTEEEKQILATESASMKPVPEELRQRAQKLIEELLSKERASGAVTDPKSFHDSLQWAGELGYPNVVVLTEDVFASGSLKVQPQLYRRWWVKDQIRLLGCVLSIVFLMFLIVVIVGSLTAVFHGK